jgi:hypothetical protein
MGVVTLVIALFFPPLWGHSWRIEGFVWQWRVLSASGNSSLEATVLNWLILFFPPCALTACTIWLWNHQMSWNAPFLRAGVVIIEASLLALLATAILFIIIFIIPAPGNGWGMAFALFNTMWAGVAFLAFLPCLLIAALILAWFQKNHQHAEG